MRKLISIMCLLLVVFGISACSGSPKQTGNTPEQQRANSREAQDELSTDVKR